MRSTGNDSDERAVAFDRFVLFPRKRLLLESGRPVQLGTRALDILTAMVEHAGELVTKEQLIASAWPDTVVHEGNLKVHIAAIRRVLAEGRNDQRYVVNVAGRGYRFVATVSTHAPTPTSRPGMVTRIFGRADVIEAISALLADHRFVTIVGSGGIGKTTVAQAISLAVTNAEDSAIFADLSPLSDPLLLPGVVAALLGLPVHSDKPLPQLVRFLRDKRILIVLDSCEHMLEAVAGLAESLLAQAPQLRLLATSREPLRAKEEVVRRLAPLEIPLESASLTADAAGAFSAVQLFVERARASSERFVLTDADVPYVYEICRQLDGNALAIELAAGRVDAFGVRGVASRLVDRFKLLEGGRRTALPRHRGLGATLDWSYDLLAADERSVLRRLSVFTGTFTLAAAGAVVGGDDSSADDIAYTVANLVDKSLVSAEINPGHSRYRLLDTTSAYAREKLQAAGELDDYALRHARYFCELLVSAGAHLQNQQRELDNVRRALDWCFSGAGYSEVGVALTIAAVPVWLNLSLMDECQQRVRKALPHVVAADDAALHLRMQLYTALGIALYSIGTSSESEAAWRQVLANAERLQNTDFELRALWGLWTVCVNDGEHGAGLNLARRFAHVAEAASDAAALLVSDRLVGISHHFLGEHATARLHIERMLGRSSAENRKTDIVRFQLDQTVASRAYLARVLWIQGYPDTAARLAEQSLSDALKIDHSLSICYCLGQSGCPIAFFNGDTATAERYIALLREHAGERRLAQWMTMARGLQGILAIRRDEHDEGLKLLRESADELRASSLAHVYTGFLAELARGLGETGHVEEGLEAIEEAISRATRNNEQWCLPELLRTRGELWLLGGMSVDRERAEAGFLQAMDIASRQGALSWELRTAFSLARMRSSKPRARRYREQLEGICGRFNEGFETLELQSARQFLGMSPHTP